MREILPLQVINAAADVRFVALGESKAEIVASVLVGEEAPRGALPAQLVRPESGVLHWVLDVGSAKLLGMGGGGAAAL